MNNNLFKQIPEALIQTVKSVTEAKGTHYYWSDINVALMSSGHASKTILKLLSIIKEYGKKQNGDIIYSWDIVNDALFRDLKLSPTAIAKVLTNLKGKDINEEAGDKEEYEKFFKATLDKFGVNSPAELDDEKKKEFFNVIDKGWKADGEKKESIEEEKAFYKNKDSIEKFDTVHIKSKNKTGLVYSIKGDKVEVETPSGKIVTKLADLEKVIDEGDKEEYEKFFKATLDDFGVESPAELDDEKKKEFFNAIDKGWKADGEKKESVQEVAKSLKHYNNSIDKNYTYKVHRLSWKGKWEHNPDDEYNSLEDAKIVAKNMMNGSSEYTKTKITKHKRTKLSGPIGKLPENINFPCKMYDSESGDLVTVKNEEEYKTYCEMGWKTEKYESTLEEDINEGYVVVAVTNDGNIFKSKIVNGMREADALKAMMDKIKEFKTVKIVNESFNDEQIEEAIKIGKGTATVSFMDIDDYDGADKKFNIKLSPQTGLKTKATGEKKNLFSFLYAIGYFENEIKKQFPELFESSEIDEARDLVTFPSNSSLFYKPKINKEKETITFVNDAEVKLALNKFFTNLKDLDHRDIKKSGKTLSFVNTAAFKMASDYVKNNMREEVETESYEYLSEPAVSQSQQKLMAMALSYKRGEMSDSEASDKVKELAANMTEKELEDFASTKTSDLPVKTEESSTMNFNEWTDDVGPFQMKDIESAMKKNGFGSKLGELASELEGRDVGGNKYEVRDIGNALIALKIPRLKAISIFYDLGAYNEEVAISEAPINDSTPINRLGGRNGLIKVLKKDPKIAKYTKGFGLYFDDADLVMGSVTVIRDVITSSGLNDKMKLGDIKKAILSTKQELSVTHVVKEQDGEWAVVGIDDKGKETSTEFMYFLYKKDAQKIVDGLNKNVKNKEINPKWVKFKLVQK